MAHQFVTKDLAKAEFMMALGFALVRTTKVDEFQHIQGGSPSSSTTWR